MNPFSDRAAAAEFARQLDARRPAGAQAQAPLVAVATRLSEAAPAPALRPEFRDALRTRLVAVATVQAGRTEAVAAPRRLTVRAPAWRSAVAVGGMASVIAVTGVAGVAAAGTQSLPGDPFYGVKRTAEAASLRLTDGPLERGERHLELASHRLDEVAGLTRGRGATALGVLGSGPTAAASPVLSAGTADLVRRTLRDMDASTRAGGRELMVAARTSGSDAPLRMLARFTARQAVELAALMPQLPAGVQTRAHVSMAVVGAVAEAAEAVMPGTSGPATPGPATPGPQQAPAPGTTPAPSATSSPTGTPSPSGQPDSPAPSATEPAPLAPVPGATPEASTPQGVTPAPGVDPGRTPDPAPTAVPTAVPSLPGVVPSRSAPALPAPVLPTPALPTLPLPPVAVPALPTVELPQVVLPTAPTLPALPGLR